MANIGFGGQESMALNQAAKGVVDEGFVVAVAAGEQSYKSCFYLVVLGWRRATIIGYNQMQITLPLARPRK